MDRQSTFDERTASGSLPALAWELVPGLVGMLLAVQSALSIVLVGRRFYGTMAIAAAPGWLVAWVATAATVALATRTVWFLGRRGGSRRFDGVVVCCPLVALLATVAALTAAQGAILLVAGLWLIVVVEELLALTLVGAIAHPDHYVVGLPVWRFLRLAPRPADRRAAPPRRSNDPAAGANASGVRGAMDPLGREPQARADTDCWLQRIERVRTAAGDDILTGSVAASFSPGQATAQIHLAFCPPFAGVPRLDYRQTEGPAGRIKVGQSLPHGVRFDVKLSSPADVSTRLLLELRAAYPAKDDVARPPV